MIQTSRPFLLGLLLLLPAAWPCPGRAQTEEPVPVLHFGDSITFGLRDAGVECGLPETAAGYPPRLATRLQALGKEIAPINEGLCGEQTSGALSRIDDVLEDHPEAEIALIMEGTNDISAQVGVETIVANLSMIADKSEEAGLLPVYSAVIPRGPETSPDSNNARTFRLSRDLLDRAAEEGRLYVNVFDPLFSMSPELFEIYYDPDGYHPNSEGYGLLADEFVDVTLAALEAIVPPDVCTGGPETLCLNDDRFRLTVTWKDFAEGEGTGQAIPLTSDTGYFWFFDDANVELIVKVLDARCLNGHFWVFYGALSNVEYEIEVVDTRTGNTSVYSNPSGDFASVGDTMAFPVPEEVDEVCPGGGVDGATAPSPLLPAPPSLAPARPGIASSARATDDTSACFPDDITLCLNRGRFEARMVWQDFEGVEGVGRSRDLTDDTGTFWFFDDSNLEVVVKVLDARGINGHYWVFYGALSNVEYRLEIRDTLTGDVVEYFNPSGNFASVGDTEAFPASAGRTDPPPVPGP